MNSEKHSEALKILSYEQLKQLRVLYGNEPMHLNTLFREKQRQEIEKDIDKTDRWLARHYEVSIRTVQRIRLRLLGR